MSATRHRLKGPRQASPHLQVSTTWNNEEAWQGTEIQGREEGEAQVSGEAGETERGKCGRSKERRLTGERAVSPLYALPRPPCFIHVVKADSAF